MLFDIPLEELKTYKPARKEPADFDAFWSATLAESRRYPLAAHFEAVDTGLQLTEAFDVSYSGYAGQTIKGWLVVPRAAAAPLPCVVEYIGYGGGRALAIDWLLWANAGYAHFVMDTRGQGTTWSTGDTPDPEPEGSNPHYPGFMTRGILNPRHYYYRRVFTDAVRAVEAARVHPLVDQSRVVVTGGSQGGGISLAVAGLVRDLSAVMPDVPFLCHFERATQIVDTYPYQEIVHFCQRHRDKTEQVFQTLAYFDGMSFAARASAPALFSVGLMDDICPPSTVYAAYNHYAAQKQIEVWPFNRHEGGQNFQSRAKLRFLKQVLP